MQQADYSENEEHSLRLVDHLNLKTWKLGYTKHLKIYKTGINLIRAVVELVLPFNK